MSEDLGAYSRGRKAISKNSGRKTGQSQQENKKEGNKEMKL